MKKVIVFGTFDKIHPGHIHMLKEAKEYGDFLIVVIARDITVCKVKGHETVNNENIRLQKVMELNIADKIRLGCIDDKYKVINEEQPDIVALGYDQREFVDNLAEALEPHVRIVRLAPYMPDTYKSSLI